MTIDSAAPILDFIENQEIDELESLQLQLIATDPNGDDDDLVFELVQGPAGSTLDSDTGLFEWTPNEFAGGFDFFVIQVRVTDAEGLSDSQRFQIVVNEINQLPVLQPIDDISIDAGQSISVQAVATDNDVPVDTLTFELTTAPEGATVSSEGLIQWTTSDDIDPETFAFTVRVSDGNGGSATESFNVNVGQAVDTLTLIENDDFLSSQSREIVVGPDANSLSFQFTPEFDTTANFVNDAFEVALVDENGQSLVHSINSDRDAFFNLTEGEVAAASVNTIQSGDTVTLDLSHIAEGTVANLVFRLVNNDSDTQSQVTITNIETSSTEISTPAGASLTANQLSEQTPVDFTLLQDVTESFTANFGQTSFNEQTDALFTNIAFTNVGQVVVSGRIVAVIKNISDEQIALIQPDGRLPDGRFFIDVTPTSSQVAPGETARTRDFQWLNEASEAFQFELTLLAEINSAPTGFTSVPPSIVEAGRELSYTAVAVDPDEGQTLRYNIVRGNELIAINEDTGVLSWVTTTENVGNNRITIRATDPFGLFTEQTFNVEVVESLQNRPPVFTTDPVTTATASSGFEVTTLATGEVPIGVSVVDGFTGPRIVTANDGDQAIGIYAGNNDDRFDDASSVSTGFPVQGDELFDVGYTVDIGIPEAASTTFSSEVWGFVQADVNNDGNLDFVTGTEFQDGFFDTRNPFIQITVNLGDGDGGFSDANVIFERNDSTVDYRSLDIADLNNDGNVDIVFADRARDGQLFSMLGDGQGGFAEANIQTFVDENDEAINISDFIVADINGDGNEDLIGRTGDVGFGGVFFEGFWVAGNGDGTFADTLNVIEVSSLFTTTSAIGEPYDVADLDGDGDLDFVFYLVNGDLPILHNDGDGNFSIVNTVTGPAGSRGLSWLQIADLTGDGNLDIGYAFANSTSSLSVAEGDGSGVEFTPRGASGIVPAVGNASGTSRPTDIDGDGDLDLLLGIEPLFGQRVRPFVAINDGSGNFTETYYPTEHFGGFDLAAFANLGDYNNDGVLDFSYAVTDVLRGGVGIRLGTRTGEFGATRAFSTPEATFQSGLAVGDFDGDDNPDIVDISSRVTRLGNGDGSFSDPVPAHNQVNINAYSAVADFNSDGLDDFVSQTRNDIFVGLSNGNGTFATPFVQDSSHFFAIHPVRSR